jgi:hypothetical protein
MLLPDSFIEKYETGQRLQTIEQSISTNQLIQSIVYKKYMFEFNAHEHMPVDNLELADSVTIIDTDNYTYNVKILDVDIQKDSDNTLYVYRITFIDLQNDANVISNYLSSVFLIERYGASALYKLVLTSSLTSDITFYTSLVPKNSRSEMETQENKLDSGLTLIAQSTDFKETKVKLFLTESEKLNLLKYGKRSTATLDPPSGSDIVSVQPIQIIETESELVDLYEFDITIYSDLLKFYHYE